MHTKSVWRCVKRQENCASWLTNQHRRRKSMNTIWMEEATGRRQCLVPFCLCHMSDRSSSAKAHHLSTTATANAPQLAQLKGWIHASTSIFAVLISTLYCFCSPKNNNNNNEPEHITDPIHCHLCRKRCAKHRKMNERKRASERKKMWIHETRNQTRKSTALSVRVATIIS